ncbi:MAG: hypothetical protein JJT77_12580 [Crocinitomicaceae bacterium]|nr:hypothetical protein [Crocinitomicaceae bacterium]
MKKAKISFLVLTAFILLAAFSRLIPHVPNFSPLGAIALFGAAHFYHKWHAFFIPVFATWLSDLIINNTIYSANYEGFVWFYPGFYWQYGSYILIVLFGLLLFKKITVFRTIGGIAMSTLVFFLVSNFGVWLSGTMYTKTIEGLITCYVAAIPFAKGTFYGSLIYTPILFGAYYLLQQKFTVLRTPKLRYN